VSAQDARHRPPAFLPRLRGRCHDLSAEARRAKAEATEGGSGSALTVLAPAKLNLFLHVGDRRPDLYHDLQSLVAFAETSDVLDVAPASELTLTISGPFAAQTPRGSGNLIVKAAQALAERFLPEPLGAAIALEKNLPVAAGLGGGSADAAAALRALNLVWDLNRSEQELIEIAQTLGSDVPACLLSRPCWMEGRGERVVPTGAMPPLDLVLVNPGVLLRTEKVFQALNARTGTAAMHPPSGIATLWELVAYLKDSGNDLEAPATLLQPDIDHVLEALEHEPACVLAQMSGSGATCFAIFDGRDYAEGAADRIAREHAHWWVRATRIAAPGIGVPRQ
jgi:4-diphosphocytidyl-2-C-methyl-D-erythritol kinase